MSSAAGPRPRSSQLAFDEPLFSLRGPVDGVERTFHLARGEHRIGSSAESDVRLPVRGVSRQHAVLRITGRGAAIEDRGSKNGTFVDGERVERAAVAPPAELRFGPVLLRLVATDSSDAELAIRFDPPARAAPSTPFDETTAFETREVPAGWLGLLAAVTEPLAERRRDGLGVALQVLVQGLKASGGWCLEWPRDGEPVVLAAAGRTGALPKTPRQTGPEGRFHFELRPRYAIGFLERGGERALSVVLWGDFPGRPNVEPLLAAILVLIAGSADRPAPPGRPSTLPALAFPPGFVPGSSPAMADLYRRMQRLSQSTEPVLLTGETGVGKEHLAHILHRSSTRRKQPFVAVNCAAIAADLLEAEMFGIERNVATGVAERRGLFQQADGGTLFLDEIGEMPLGLQPKLLRGLQEREIRPVGGELRTIDVRVVAATNADLEERMEAGSFRRDLYYRVAGAVLEVPPLRRRREDVGPLVEHFLSRFGAETGSRPRGLSVKALGHLVAYSWPGNVRELEHEVRRLIDGCPDGEVIDSAMLTPRIAEVSPIEAPSGELALDRQIEALERELIAEALRRADGRRLAAARLLGISRNRLARKIEQLGLGD